MASCEDRSMYKLAVYITGTGEEMKTVPEFPISNLSYARVWLGYCNIGLPSAQGRLPTWKVELLGSILYSAISQMHWLALASQNLASSDMTDLGLDRQSKDVWEGSSQLLVSNNHGLTG